MEIVWNQVQKEAKNTNWAKVGNLIKTPLYSDLANVQFVGASLLQALKALLDDSQQTWGFVIYVGIEHFQRLLISFHANGGGQPQYCWVYLRATEKLLHDSPQRKGGSIFHPHRGRLPLLNNQTISRACPWHPL